MAMAQKAKSDSNGTKSNSDDVITMWGRLQGENHNVEETAGRATAKKKISPSNPLVGARDATSQKRCVCRAMPESSTAMSVYLH